MKMKKKSMKKWLKTSATLALSASLSVSALPLGALGMPNIKAETEEKVVDVVQNAANEHQIKNIIYMIPDGGGYASYDIAKAVKEAGGVNYAGTKQTSNKMYLDNYFAGSIHTRSNNAEVTDSAAAGTALATGNKTNNDYTGVDANSAPMANILELCQLEGKATGLVATSYQYDATPAAFSAHVGSRKAYNQIISQLLNQGINVIMGGGIQYKNYVGTTDWVNKIRNKGYRTVASKNDLKNVANCTYGDASEEVKVWSTNHATYQHISYDMGYGGSYDGINDNGNTPTLAEMTDASIKMLSQDKDGFFLMVEGSKIDYANHHRKMTESATEWIAFDEAFKVAMDYAKQRKDTVVVVAPDHNTGVISIRDGQMNNIVRAVQKKEDTNRKSDWMEFTSDNYDSESPHSGHDVPFWLYVPEGATRLNKVAGQSVSESDSKKYAIDNTDIAPYLASLVSDLTLKNATDTLYIDVTSQGSMGSDKFTFSNVNCSAEYNSDKAYINGQAVDLKGELCIASNGKMYVPKSLLDAADIPYTIVNPEDITGSGTKEDPYCISNQGQFLKFTNEIKKGNHYEGKYIKQTANIDMEGVADYSGLAGAKSNGKDSIYFAGNYDGQGHTLNVKINASNTEGIAVFPYTSGTIMNLGVTGSITNNASDNGCAGIVRTLVNHTNGYTEASAGKIINCWSTVDVKANKEAAGIALSVESGAGVYQCYYKGKVTANQNYGVANGEVKYSGYQMTQGSSNVSGNQAGGQAMTDFSAATLNAHRGETVQAAGLTSDDQLCKFANANGEAFSFAGNIVKLEKIVITYRATDGQEKEKTIDGFKSDQLFYEVMMPNDLDADYEFTVGGVAVAMDGQEEVITYQTKLDEKGFGNGKVGVKSNIKTAYYETAAYTEYVLIISGPEPTGNRYKQTPTPIATAVVTTEPTATPDVTTAPTATPDVTTVPTATVTIAPTATPNVTTAPTATVSATPTATPRVTITPSAVPNVPTVIYQIEATPVVTVAPTTKIALSDCQITVVKSRYAYTGNAIDAECIVSYNGAILKQNTDYTLSYTNNTNVGVGIVTITGKGNYTGTAMRDFSIVSQSIQKAKITKKISGKHITITVKANGSKLKKNKDYKISTKNNRKKHKLTIVVKGIGNYSGAKKLTVKY